MTVSWLLLTVSPIVLYADLIYLHNHTQVTGGGTGFGVKKYIYVAGLIILYQFLPIFRDPCQSGVLGIVLTFPPYMALLVTVDKEEMWWMKLATAEFSSAASVSGPCYWSSWLTVTQSGFWIWLNVTGCVKWLCLFFQTLWLSICRVFQHQTSHIPLIPSFYRISVPVPLFLFESHSSLPLISCCVSLSTPLSLNSLWVCL